MSSLIKKFLFSCGLLLGAMPISFGVTKHMTIADLWVRAMPPGSSMSAVYFQIANLTSIPDEILKVSSTAASSVSIHQTKIQNGMAMMAPVTHLTLAPAQKLQFEPGGYHLMLEELKQPLIKGQTISLTFYFRHHEAITMAASIR